MSLTPTAAPLIPITAVLILAAALRIIGANDYPLWTDEGWSVWAAQDHVIDALANDRHPPLYFAALYGWRPFAGDSRIALRFLSIAAGLITVAAVYRIGADTFNRRAGWYAAFGMSILTTAIYYSQEVRHYGWLTLFTALSWMFLLRYAKQCSANRRSANRRSANRPQAAPLIGYVLSVTAMLYTLYFAAFTLIAQAAALLILPMTRRHKLHIVSAWIASALLYIPWLYVILTIQAAELGAGIAGFPGSLTVPDDLALIVQLLVGNPIIGFGVLFFGVIALQRSPSSAIRRRGFAVVIGGIGLFAALFLLSLRYQLFAPRTLVFLAPLIMVVFGAGLSVFPRWIGAIILFAWLPLTYTTPVQDRLAGDRAAAVIASEYQSGDLIIIEAGWDDHALAYEVDRVLPDDARIVRTIGWTNYRIRADVVVEVTPLLRTHDRVWVIQWLQAPSVMPYLEGGVMGFSGSVAEDVPAGAYGERFAAPIIRVRRFDR